MSYQGIRHEPIFDVLPGLEPPPAAPSPAPPREPRQRPAAAWLGLSASAVLLALPTLAMTKGPADRADPIETGSISGPNVTGFTLQLAAGSDPARLRETWQGAVAGHAEALAGLQPALVPMTANERPWSLTAGEFRNAARAADRCEELKAVGMGCEISRRDGAALMEQP